MATHSAFQRAGIFTLMLFVASAMVACAGGEPEPVRATYAPPSDLTHRVYALDSGDVPASSDEKVAVITNVVAAESWNDGVSGHRYSVDDNVLVVVTDRLNHYHIRRYLVDGTVPAPEPMIEEAPAEAMQGEDMADQESPAAEDDASDEGEEVLEAEAS